MPTPRTHLLDWIDQNQIPTPKLPAAVTLVQIHPTRSTWRTFLDRLLLSLGTALLATGVIFFFASNWQDLGQFAKFALVQLLVVVSLAVIWTRGLDRPSGKAALFAASLFLGALLALTGQTYQTGADTFGLFATWAVMILPWVLVGRSASLWLLWLALVNTAVILYFGTTTNLFFGSLHSLERHVLASFLINATALAIWERILSGGSSPQSARWAPRLLAFVLSGFATTLAMSRILDGSASHTWTAMVYPVWLVASFLVYRRRIPDLFVLAIGVLSIIIVIATSLVDGLNETSAVSFLIVGVVVIVLSAVSGLWLQRLSRELTE